MAFTIYQSIRSVADPMCVSRLDAMNQSSWPMAVKNPQCAPCLQPQLPHPTCCCGCYRVTFSDDGLSVFSGGTFDMTFNHYACQTPPPPLDVTACGWGVPDGMDGEEYPTMSQLNTSIFGTPVGPIVFVEDLAGGHANAGYLSSDFTCGKGGRFTLSASFEGHLSFDPSPIGYYPSTCIVVPIPCSSSSSSSSSS